MEENMSISRFFSRSLKNIPDFDIKYRSLKKGENLYDEYSKDTQTVFAEYAGYYSQPISKTKYIYEDMSQLSEICPFIISLSLMVTSYKICDDSSRKIQ